MLKIAVVPRPRPRAGIDNATPRRLEAAIVTTVDTLAAAATNAAPENEKNEIVIRQTPLGNEIAELETTLS